VSRRHLSCVCERARCVTQSWLVSGRLWPVWRPSKQTNSNEQLSGTEGGHWKAAREFQGRQTVTRKAHTTGPLVLQLTLALVWSLFRQLLLPVASGRRGALGLRARLGGPSSGGAVGARTAGGGDLCRLLLGGGGALPAGVALGGRRRGAAGVGLLLLLLLMVLLVLGRGRLVRVERGGGGGGRE